MKATSKGMKSPPFWRAAFVSAAMLIMTTSYSQLILDWQVLVPLRATMSVVDSSGNSYVTGGKDVIVNGSVRQDAYLRKYDSHGNFIWERTVDNPDFDDWGWWVGLDRFGNVYNVGMLGNAGDFANHGELEYLAKIYVQKFSPEGIRLWLKTYGGVTTHCALGSVCLDGEGRVFVSAAEYVDLYDCRDTIPGHRSHTGALAGSYGVILKYEASGLETVMKYYGRGGDRVTPVSWTDYEFVGICADEMGGVYAHWGFGTECPQNNSASWFSGTAIVHHSQAGAVVWQKIWRIGETPLEYLAGLGKSGGIYTFRGSAGQYTLRRYSSTDGFVWEAPFGAASGYGGILEDGEGHVYAALGNLLAKYESNGTEIWRASLPYPASGSSRIAFDRSGLIHHAIGCFDANGNRLWWGGGGNIDANGCSYMLDNSDYNGNYLRKYIAGRIISPAKGDLWISGERDSIRWGASLGDTSFDIEYSEDGGSTYQTVASGIRADSLHYAWDLPARIAPQANNKVRFHNAAKNLVLAVSEPFGVKPYLLTRKKDASTDELVAYGMATDRWGFGNTSAEMFPPDWHAQFDYQGIDPFTGTAYPQSFAGGIFGEAKNGDFPDWVSFVNAFTLDACYWNHTLGLYSATAVGRWRDWKGPWGGSCFGIALTNAFAFARRASFQDLYPGFPVFGQPIEVLASDGVRSVVNELFTHQYGDPHRKVRTWNWMTKTPTETLADLKAMFQEPDVPVKVLMFYRNKTDSGGHAVLPYSLKRIEGAVPGNFKLRVWDNSNPNDTTLYILIDSSALGGQGYWQYPTWAGWGGNWRLFLMDSLGGYFTPPALPKHAETERNTSPFAVDTAEIQFFTRTAASVIICDQQGRTTGLRKDSIVTEIPGSAPLIMLDGYGGGRYGYVAPTAAYSLTLSGFQDSVARLTVATGNRTVSIRRRGAGPAETDRFFYDGGLSIANPDAAGKTITFESIVRTSGDEKVCVFRGLSLAREDTVRLENIGEDQLKLSSTGSARAYDLELNDISATQLGVFGRRGVTLEPGSSHILIPEWTGLNGSHLVILIDRGNDGTIDDTLNLANESTGLQEQGSLVPSDYLLCQNYPNPFNPLTTIRYGLPQKSVVRLAVYNLLGQEVAVLVQGEQAAGFHEVKFEAPALASGIYLYRLIAGNPTTGSGLRAGSGGFAQSRKMIVVK